MLLGYGHPKTELGRKESRCSAVSRQTLGPMEVHGKAVLSEWGLLLHISSDQATLPCALLSASSHSETLGPGDSHGTNCVRRIPELDHLTGSMRGDPSHRRQVKYALSGDNPAPIRCGRHQELGRRNTNSPTRKLPRTKMR